MTPVPTIDVEASASINPEQIDVVRPDLLQELVKVIQQMQRAKDEYISFKNYYDYLSAAVRQEYNLGEQDSINVETGLITRGADQPAPQEETQG